MGKYGRVLLCFFTHDRNGTELMAFPLEIRRELYHHSLYVGFVYPYGEWPDEARRPNVSLLRISKKVHEEAECTLYQNVFDMRSYESIQNLFSKSLPTENQKLLLKHIRVWPTEEDLIGEETRAVVDQADLRLFDLNLNMREGETQPNFFRCIHEIGTARLRDFLWPRKIHLILQHLCLESLILDLREALCPMACCAWHATAGSCFSSGFVYGLPKRVDIKWFDTEMMVWKDETSKFRVTMSKICALRRAGCRRIPTAETVNFGSEGPAWLLKMMDEEERGYGRWAQDGNDIGLNAFLRFMDWQ